MKTFEIKYNGNSRLVKGLLKEQPVIVSAENERQAVEHWYCDHFNEEYFPDDSGNVIDASGDIVARPGDDGFKYDGGNIYAIEFREKLRVEHVSGSWNLEGTVFYGTIVLENGANITGEFSESDYDWDGLWTA